MPLDHPAELLPADYFRRLTASELFPANPERPLELDVGCGDGAFLLGMAAHYPERNFLGIERLFGRVAKSLRHATRHSMDNVRVLHLESSYALGWLLPEACASRVHLLFPDPWPKKKHAARRFVAPDKLAAIHRTLAAGGEFLFKTDHADYFAESTEVVDASPLFQRIDWIPEDECYPLTDFEKQWIAQGCGINCARWRKVG